MTNAIPAPAPHPAATVPDAVAPDGRRPDRVVDVLVVGGGPAGLSAALTLARARRDVLVVDAGEPRNAPAAGVHGYLGHDGVAPAELTRLGRVEVESYGGEVRPGVVTTIERVDAPTPGSGRPGPGAGGAARFVATVADEHGGSHPVRARRVVVATGLTDELPPVEGLAARWGRDVVHCPYCHGWEVRDRVVGVIGGGPNAVHQALLFTQWTDRVTLFLADGPEPTDEQWEQLAARRVGVVTGLVTALRVDDDRLTGITLAGGRTVPVEVGVVGAPMRANAAVLAGLGLAPVPHPAGVGDAVGSDPTTGATTVPGVWVAGNVGDLSAQVVTAAAGGQRVGAMANADLLAEDTAAAVARRRLPFSARTEAENAASLLGDRRHGFEPVTSTTAEEEPAVTDPAPHADHDQDDAAAEPLFDRAYWEDRYGAEGLAWSGRPNPVLVTEAEALTPGRALDIGSGEGGDAIWLAGLGWQVVGTDISSNALAKSARQAESVDAELAARIDWQQHDLVEWAPEARSFDLVTSQFMHLPDPVRTALFRSLAAAVAPGGTLLVVGHDLSDLDSGAHRMHHAELMFSVDDVLAAIDGEGLVVEVAESRPRLAPGADGGTVTVRDVVVRATRAS